MRYTATWPWGSPFLAGGIGALLIGILLYCQVVLIHKFVNYAYRAYDTLLEAADLLRRGEEHSRMIAENSNLSEWAKRVVYREKDYEFLRDTIQGAVIRQDWESAEHLIRDVDTEFGYHDEAAHLREKLEQARKATTSERIAAALARFETLCGQQKWDQRGVSASGCRSCSQAKSGLRSWRRRSNSGASRSSSSS